MAELLLEALDDGGEMSADEKRGIAKSLILMMKQQQEAQEHQASEQKFQMYQQAAMLEKILERFSPAAGQSSTAQPVQPGRGSCEGHQAARVQELVVKQGNQ